MTSQVPAHEMRLAELVLGDERHRKLLTAVSELDLPDCWLAAGFVRNLVWDRLHGRLGLVQLNDIDVVYFNPGLTEPAVDRRFEAALRERFPAENFSVKNQARMHRRNGHPPYADTGDSITRWPETCTALGVAWRDGVEILAPFGLSDLFSLVVRPTATDPETVALVERRVVAKGWRQRWPRLVFELP
ncbi:nucleotidyltransferase family protein [Plantactinospora sp. WMMB782]|uniref:nucleotidyltransferase family protein n=1 Tax=Plantactinospora sp. WMMB782 TaxID=3404121 RepID=UPI003B92DBDC